jgi:ppGpp synthetase/RelA/SpoT-type nucleotidyltranferase
MPEFILSWQAKRTQQAVGVSAQPSAAFPTVHVIRDAQGTTCCLGKPLGRPLTAISPLTRSLEGAATLFRTRPLPCHHPLTGNWDGSLISTRSHWRISSRTTEANTSRFSAQNRQTMGARARQQWRYGNYRIHPSGASHLATLGDYRLSRSEAFGDGFSGAAALWIILGKRGRRKSGLQSPTMELSRMADVIGLRIVCESIALARKITDELRSTQSVASIQDYWESPQETGYRAYHIICRRSQRRPDGRENISVDYEVQIRTYFQHLWGLVSESLGERVKEGGGRSDVREYLSRLSRVIRDWEISNSDVTQHALPELSREHKLTVARVHEGTVRQFQQFGKDYQTAISLLLSWEEDLNKGDAETLLLSGVGEPKILLQHMRVSLE